MKFSIATIQTLLSLTLLAGIGAGCTSYVDLKAPAKGSPENPVRCDGPEGQRIYLSRLRSQNNQVIRFRYIDSVLGPQARILDRFAIENPDYPPEHISPVELFRDGLREEPDYPTDLRVYMDMYHPGVFDNEPVEGFNLEPFASD